MSFGQLGSLGRGFGRLGGGSGSVVPSGVIAAGGGSYAWTGQDASLVIEAPASIAADAGSYAWTGDTMTPLQDHFVTAPGGSYAWTGQDATLTASGGSLGLQANLTGFWSFEDTSWVDDTASGTTLTAVGSPTSVTGKVGNAASVGNSANALTATSNTNILNGGSSFSVAAWVNTGGTSPGEWILFNKDNTSFGQREWGLGSRFTSANVWSFVCSNTSTTLFRADAAASGAGLVAGSGWVHLVATFNSATGALVLYVNGSASGSGATLTGTMNSTASAPLGIGRQGTATPTSINPALVDQAGFWKGRVLSAGDVTALYNSGNGLSYAAMA